MTDKHQPTAEMDALKAANLECYAELAIMQQHVLEFDAEVKKRRALEAEIKTIHASTSWRLTAPLRHVVRGMKRLFK